MILHYLFFGIDSGILNFCRDKRVYEGFDLIITEYVIGSDYFLDKVKELIESMVKFNPQQRESLEKIKNSFQVLFVELNSFCK